MPDIGAFYSKVRIMATHSGLSRPTRTAAVLVFAVVGWTMSGCGESPTREPADAAEKTPPAPAMPPAAPAEKTAPTPQPHAAAPAESETPPTPTPQHPWLGRWLSIQDQYRNATADQPTRTTLTREFKSEGRFVETRANGINTSEIEGEYEFHPIIEALPFRGRLTIQYRRARMECDIELTDDRLTQTNMRVYGTDGQIDARGCRAGAVWYREGVVDPDAMHAESRKRAEPRITAPNESRLQAHLIEHLQAFEQTITSQDPAERLRAMQGVLPTPRDYRAVYGQHAEKVMHFIATSRAGKPQADLLAEDAAAKRRRLGKLLSIRPRDIRQAPDLPQVRQALMLMPARIPIYRAIHRYANEKGLANSDWDHYIHLYGRWVHWPNLAMMPEYLRYVGADLSALRTATSTPTTGGTVAPARNRPPTPPAIANLEPMQAKITVAQFVSQLDLELRRARQHAKENEIIELVRDRLPSERDVRVLFPEHADRLIAAGWGRRDEATLRRIALDMAAEAEQAQTQTATGIDLRRRDTTGTWRSAIALIPEGVPVYHVQTRSGMRTAGRSTYLYLHQRWFIWRGFESLPQSMAKLGLAPTPRVAAAPAPPATPHTTVTIPKATAEDLARFKALSQGRRVPPTAAAPAPPPRQKKLSIFDRMRDKLLNRARQNRADRVQTNAAGDIVALDLSSMIVGDGDLIFIKNMKALTTLKLNNTAVTDAGLVHIRQLPKLDTLELTGSGVTDKAAVQLMQERPALTVTR